MSNKYCVVTGGAGYIGSVVCEYLRKEDITPIIIDDLREGNIKAVPPEAIFFQENFGKPGLMDEIFKKYRVEAVLHLAALANVPDSVINPVQYYENNVINTLSLLDSMRRQDVKNIIFSSTAAVYGEPVYVPIDEKHNLYPINPYGHSKLMNEQMIRDFSRAYGLNFTIFRYFCAAGATQKNGERRSKETHIIPLVIDTALGRKETFDVFGNDYGTKDGSGVRDFIHVGDIANAHILALHQINSGSNLTMNLGRGEGYSVYEVIEATERITGKKVKYKVSDRRPGDPGTLTASAEWAQKKLGWRPLFTLDDIIRSAYEWRLLSFL